MVLCSEDEIFEVILLKCYDSADDGRACFTGHTGFLNPNLPKTFTPRESIEARTLWYFRRRTSVQAERLFDKKKPMVSI